MWWGFTCRALRDTASGRAPRGLLCLAFPLPWRAVPTAGGCAQGGVRSPTRVPGFPSPGPPPPDTREANSIYWGFQENLGASCPVPGWCCGPSRRCVSPRSPICPAPRGAACWPRPLPTHSKEQTFPCLVFILAAGDEGSGTGLKTSRKKAFCLAGLVYANREEGWRRAPPTPDRQSCGPGPPRPPPAGQATVAPGGALTLGPLSAGKRGWGVPAPLTPATQGRPRAEEAGRRAGRAGPCTLTLSVPGQPREVTTSRAVEGLRAPSPAYSSRQPTSRQLHSQHPHSSVGKLRPEEFEQPAPGRTEYKCRSLGSKAELAGWTRGWGGGCPPPVCAGGPPPPLPTAHAQCPPPVCPPLPHPAHTPRHRDPKPEPAASKGRVAHRPGVPAPPSPHARHRAPGRPEAAALPRSSFAPAGPGPRRARAACALCVYSW